MDQQYDHEDRDRFEESDQVFASVPQPMDLDGPVTSFQGLIGMFQREPKGKRMGWSVMRAGVSR